MTAEEERQCMRLLEQARSGDEGAYEPLTAALAHHFSYMIRGYRSSDPAYDLDDLMTEFRLAIWQYIDRVDGRGNPLFHLAWRGERAVCALLGSIKQKRSGTPEWVRDFGSERSIGTLPESWDLVDPRPESDPQYVVQVKETRNEAHQHVVNILARISLTPRQNQVLEWMMRDPSFDEEGANLRLAQHLGVSEQAASALRRKVLIAMGADDAHEQFECDGCGRPFNSKGALTQHKRGSSGHRRCPALVA